MFLAISLRAIIITFIKNIFNITNNSKIILFIILPMSNLKSSIYSQLYNAAVAKIETVTPHDLSKKKIILAVESALQFLQQPKNYDYKDKLILQLLEAFTVKSTTASIIKGVSDHVDWYDPYKNPRPYWDTYREYIKNDQQFSADAVSAHVVGAATLFIVTADEIFAPGVYQSRREAAAAN